MNICLFLFKNVYPNIQIYLGGAVYGYNSRLRKIHLDEIVTLYTLIKPQELSFSYSESNYYNSPFYKSPLYKFIKKSFDKTKRNY